LRRQVIAIVRKDLLLERRGKANLNALIFLGCLILLIVSFALGPDRSRLHTVAGGVLWIAFAFAGILAFSRAYQSEETNKCFEGMLLAGTDPKAIYLGKLLGTIIVMLVVEVVVTTAMTVLYALSFGGSILFLALAGVLGTVGIAAVGVLYGRLTMSLRAREIMLPLLVLPVVVPVLLAAVQATSLTLNGSTSGISIWIELLAVFDVVFVTAGVLTYETLCEL